MPMMQNRQYRALEFEVRKAADESAEKSYIVEGYAANYEPYVLWEDEGGAVYEQFNRSAFDACDMSDVIFQYNHEGRVFARMSNNTLSVIPDDKGLHVIADLSKTAASREMFEDIASGLVTKMSWGFMPQDYEYDNKTRTIVHTRVKKIFDVSAVSIPANNTTDIHARSFAEGVIGDMMQELQERERKQKMLDLKLKLGGF